MSLIQTLHTSSPRPLLGGLLPHLLTRERLSGRRLVWRYVFFVVDRVTVKVRVISNLPNATLVMVERLSEYDWEVLELKSEHAEAAMLKQVLVLHETMNFPLWLHGQAVTFCVISTYTGKAVGKMRSSAIAVSIFTVVEALYQAIVAIFDV